ncbi:hypothetical protein SERLA73DRAFT_185089 [Serpula lacrymans var. lacrymans S7.3]|uniref:Vacuolar ATPase assembly integral membrane protein VMA21 n=2 Tax=Serpula lacrymans var. lacrymans TaxID=341189 RepID=F8Q417_SERL3|nr:uncharacterized protein SERLADRAFT_473340 [Serpula lacrymans var. lacrymans S7.9]EGN96873.1 hypothetical protein SERLA73DRAFT_185089 [Serpula lacrymans var. lacrymans S7.3]EGO22473.1 hypothetical protein SERLADRAFT_473340 [Serpula lacrymans var. lacrymans S7.9]
MSEKTAIPKVTATTASRAILLKLIFFSASLAVLPISSYFISQKYFWSGNANYAAITAVLVANAVLVSYIVSSVMDDKESMRSAEQHKLGESKKER